MEIFNLGLLEVNEKLQSSELSAVELIQNTINRIEDTKSLNSFISLYYEAALQKASELDAKRKSGAKLGKLAGIPLSLKDNIAVRGTTLTCASEILKGYTPDYNSDVAQNLIDEDAVIIGKTNMDEFAMGVGNTNTCFGQPRNPHNTQCVPGGSSGGSAVSVSASQVFGSLGTDTGGSIRQPSAYCGIVGLKPTYGTVSGRGIVPMAQSFDQAGTLTRSVHDNALMYSVISNRPSIAATASSLYNSAKTKNYDALISAIKNKRVAFSPEFLDCLNNPALKTYLTAALELFQDLGATITRPAFPLFKTGLPVYSVMSRAEVEYNLSRIDGIEYGRNLSGTTAHTETDIATESRTLGLGIEAKKRIMLGRYFTNHPEYIEAAKKTRRAVCAQAQSIFAECDILLSPTSLIPAFKATDNMNNPDIDRSDMFTVIANLTGQPAISIPCGTDENKMPLGIQLMSRHHAESELFTFASAYEQLK